MGGTRVVVVTGANRGIGLAICEQILLQHNPVKLYACSRAGKDLGFKNSDKSSTVTYPKLDITNMSQIEDLASQISSTDGHVDVLINNAGTNKYAEDPKEAHEIMETNYTGTAAMCHKFLPLVKASANGRIVNVSSTGSSLRPYDKVLQNQLRDPNITFKDIDALAEKYLQRVESGNMKGWGDDKGYCFSKACVNALTVALARENPEAAINCCCPGWVDTDMGKIVGQPSKTPEEGARIPLKLGFDNIDNVSGRYWSNPGVSDTADGKVMAW